MVSHLPWEQGIGGSNPLTSTSSMGARAALSVIARSPTETMRSEHPPLGLKRDSGPLFLQVWLSGRASRSVSDAGTGGSIPLASRPSITGDRRGNDETRRVFQHGVLKGDSGLSFSRTRPLGATPPCQGGLGWVQIPPSALHSRMRSIW